MSHNTRLFSYAIFQYFSKLSIPMLACLYVSYDIRLFTCKINIYMIMSVVYFSIYET